MRTKIVFDLGGVLLDWDPRYLYQKIFEDRAEMEYFLAEICGPAWNAQMDAGRPFQEAIFELIGEYPHYAEQIQAYFSRWEEMMGGAFPETVEILGELRERGYALGALSNWSAETFPRVRPNYGFLEWFDPLVLSGQMGVAKPDSALFRIFLREADWRAEDCLFIDDAPANVSEAARQGFDTIHFLSPQQLRGELALRGLLNGIERA